MTTPFEYINAINYSKENLMVDEVSIKEYNAFMVNRGLSYFPDTILYANEINRFYQIDKDMQFSFLLNSIPKRKRFSKWAKQEKDEPIIEIIKEQLLCTSEKAREYLLLLSDDAKKQLLVKKLKGGKTK